MPPRGKCNECGEVYTEWALEQEKNRKCDKIVGRNRERCNGEIVLDDALDERDEWFVGCA